jgi:hypothetical protein
MPRITLPPLPTENQSLLQTTDFSNINDPYTKSIYQRLDLADPEEGLMSMANGRLTTPNLGDNFKVRAEHVQREQAALAAVASMSDTSTIYANGVSGSQKKSETESFEDSFFVIPGCSFRWYQPYDTTISLLQWSFFASFNCWRGVYTDIASTAYRGGVNGPIKFRCVLNDSVIDASDRVLGQNMFHPVSPAAAPLSDIEGPGFDSYEDGSANKPLRGGNPRYVQTEAHSGVHFDFHHATSISKGYNEISVECAMLLPRSEAVYVQNVGAYNRGKFKMRGYFNLTGKLSVGIRNARVLNLL